MILDGICWLAGAVIGIGFGILNLLGIALCYALVSFILFVVSGKKSIQ